MKDSRIILFETEAAKVLDFLHSEFSRLQTGRANALMVEHIEVEAYGQKQQLRAVASVSVENATTITVQPWDKAIMGDVERALTLGDFGCSPVNDGVCIRLVLPPMTEERRKSLVKTVHQLTEEAKISVRHNRHEAKSAIEKDPDENLRNSLLSELQKAVDSANHALEESMKAKEHEVMTI